MQQLSVLLGCLSCLSCGHTRRPSPHPPLNCVGSSGSQARQKIEQIVYSSHISPLPINRLSHSSADGGWSCYQLPAPHAGSPQSVRLAPPTAPAPGCFLWWRQQRSSLFVLCGRGSEGTRCLGDCGMTNQPIRDPN